LTTRQTLRISASDLDELLTTLEVRFVALTECLVSPGHMLQMGGADAPGIHYNIFGRGWMFVRNDPPIELKPHTLIIVPPNAPFRMEVAAAGKSSAHLRAVDGRLQTAGPDGVRRVVAGEGTPEIILICGFFHAAYGSSTDLFAALSTPIVEEFDASDRLDHALKAALAELISQEAGAGAMSSALLKQVIVALLRRSLQSANHWAERFSMLSDRQIARAFAAMAAHPGAAHTTQSLADLAHLSRSAFMSRFTDTVGRPPMIVLRDLRMRQAAQQLKNGTFSVDQVARNAGYESRSSFVRAFRKVYDTDPSHYRIETKSAHGAVEA